MDEFTKIAACALEAKKQLENTKNELSENEDSGVLEFDKAVDNFISWLLDVGAIKYNEKTQEYEVTAQIPFKVMWILKLNGDWWLNLKDGIEEGK